MAVYQFTLISGILSLGGTSAGLRSKGFGWHPICAEQGIGAALMADAEARARAGGAGLLQFTTNRQRDRAQAFYRRMGFVDSHIGFSHMG